MEFFSNKKYVTVKSLIVMIIIVICTMLRLGNQGTLAYLVILLANFSLIVYLFINILFFKREEKRILRIASLVVSTIIFILLLLV